MASKDRLSRKKTQPLPGELRKRAKDVLKSNYEGSQDNDFALKEMSFSANDAQNIENISDPLLSGGAQDDIVQHDTTRNDAKDNIGHNVNSDDNIMHNAEAGDDALPKTSSDNYFKTDDVDNISYTTTLPDDGVPNMPGAILAHAREMLGLSQSTVAHKLKLRVNTISDIEHDRLNQITAAPFTKVHIYKYAKLVNIDADAVVALYEENVRALYEEIGRTSSVKKNRSYLYALGAICIIFISTVIYLATGSDGAGNNADGGEIVLNTNAGSTGTDIADALSDTGTVVIEENNSLQTPEIVIDKNTLMAQEQAQALGSNLLEDSAEEKKVELSKEALLTSAKTQIQSVKEAARLPADNTAVKTDNVKTANVKADNIITGGESSSQAAAKSTALADKNEIQRDEETKTSSVKAVLSSNLKDISASAKIVNREGLASLNSVSVSIRGDVALIIKDSRGKILKDGSFKKGDRISVTGIPPLEISVSDTRAVTVNYMGGRISVPDAKQVKYKLPQR